MSGALFASIEASSRASLTTSLKPRAMANEFNRLAFNFNENSQFFILVF